MPEAQTREASLPMQVRAMPIGMARTCIGRLASRVWASGIGLIL